MTLRLHEKPEDYCVLFDVHEDVVALDSATAPKKARVYQIKSDTTSPWTVAGLTKREKSRTPPGHKPSVLGKLYNNYLQFPGCIESMYFVTNAPFSILLADGSPCNDHETIGIDELDSSEKATVQSRIAVEHSVSNPPAGLSLTFLVRTTLSVGDHEQHTEGIISNFLQSHGDGTIPPAPFHKTLRSELRRRNDKETAATTFAELAKTKGLTRADLQQMLDSVPSDRRMSELNALIRNQLIKEGANLRYQAALNSEVRKYLAKRLDLTNTVLVEARKRATLEVGMLSDDIFDSATPIANIINQITNISSPEFTSIQDRYSEFFLHAIISVAIYEHHEFPTSDTQSEEEAA